MYKELLDELGEIAEKLEAFKNKYLASDIFLAGFPFDGSIEEITEGMCSWHKEAKKVAKTFNELSIAAKAMAVYKYTLFVNVDGSLDRCSVKDIAESLEKTDYHFFSNGELFRDKNGNLV